MFEGGIGSSLYGFWVLGAGFWVMGFGFWVMGDVGNAEHLTHGRHGNLIHMEI